MVKFIDAHRERWGVEPICRALQVAPSTYYAAVKRPLSARRQRDEQLQVEIGRVHRDNFGVYGIEKVWHQLNREGKKVGRDRVHRLMREMDLEGVVRGKRKPITPSRRGRLSWTPDRPTWSSATLPPPRRTSCGWPT